MNSISFHVYREGRFDKICLTQRKRQNNPGPHNPLPIQEGLSGSHAEITKHSAGLFIGLMCLSGGGQSDINVFLPFLILEILRI